MRTIPSTITAAAVASLVAAPVGAWAAHSFGDVPSSHPHHAGIGYVTDAGITAGCSVPGNYCPAAGVTRGQMGTFLHRASGNAPGIAPSVIAATLQGQTPLQITGRLSYQVVSTPTASPYVHSSSTHTEQVSCAPDELVLDQLFAPVVATSDPDWVYTVDPGDITELMTAGQPTGYSVTWTSYDFSAGPPGVAAASPEQWDATITLDCIGVEPLP